MSFRSPRSIAFLWMLLVVLCSLSIIYRLSVGQAIDTNILNLLPSTKLSPEMDAAIDKLTRQQSQKIVLLVGSRDKQVAASAVDELSEQLATFADSLFFHAESGPDLLKDFSEIYRFYLPYKNGLLSDDDWVALSQKKFTKLVQRATQNLYSPVSAIRSSLLQEDPLFTFSRFLNAQQGSTPLNWYKGRPYVSDGEYSYFLYIGELKKSAFDLDLQTALVQQLNGWQLSISKVSEDFQLLRTGALFFAQAGVESARKEISIVGVGSAIAILMLVLVIFRGLMPLLLSLFAIYCGIAFGAAATLLIYDQINLMALVFGATLLGISIDYSFHFWAEYCFNGENLKADGVVRLIRPALTLGLLSSCLAFVSLMFGNFPGLQQIAIIATLGLLGAYLTVVSVFPLFAKSRRQHRAIPLQGLLFGLTKIKLSYCQRLTLLVGVLLLSLMGIAKLVPNDDVKLLQPLAATLKSQQHQIEHILQQEQMQQFFMVRGDTLEVLLQREEGLREQMRSMGVDIKSLKMLSTLIPSQLRQASANQLLTLLMDDAAAQDYFVTTGLPHPDLSVTEYLQAKDVAQSPLAKQSSELLISDKGPYISVVYVPAKVEKQALAKLHQPTSGIFWIDRAADISHIFARYRATASTFLILSGALILLFFLIRYGVRQGVLLAGVPITSCSLVLCLLALLQVDFNLFHLLGLMVVAGLGLDYSIFLTEHQGRQLPTLLAVILSVCTSLLAFGLLSFSATPAVSAFGLSVLLGVSSMFVLAVLVLSSPTVRSV